MKQNLVIWANCFGIPLKYTFDKYYSDKYNISYCVNYDIINNKKELPECFNDADIFIYQNYNDKIDSVYDLKNILNTKLKKDCIKICFPTLHSCNLLFGYLTEQDEENKLTINDSLPFGQFFFSIEPIKNILKYETNYDINIIIEEIYEKSISDNFIKEERINYFKNRTFDFLRNKIFTSDIPELYNFIENNYKNIRLWHNPNHPSGVLINKTIELIFNKLNLIYNPNKEDQFYFENSLSDWVMPIFPCVKKYHNLNYDCSICSSWYHKDIYDIRSYIGKYIKFLCNK